MRTSRRRTTIAILVAGSGLIVSSCAADPNDVAGGKGLATATSEAPATTALGTTTATTTTTVPGTTTVPETTAITVKDFAFSPPAIKVHTGDTVTWTNADGVVHRIQMADGSFTGHDLHTGDKSTVTFPNAGTYSYFCGIHNSMTGTVQVS